MSSMKYKIFIQLRSFCTGLRRSGFSNGNSLLSNSNNFVEPLFPRHAHTAPLKCASRSLADPGFGGSIWRSKKASKIISKIGALGLENGGSGEAPGEAFSEPKKEARGGAH